MRLPPRSLFNNTLGREVDIWADASSSALRGGADGAGAVAAANAVLEGYKRQFQKRLEQDDHDMDEAMAGDELGIAIDHRYRRARPGPLQVLERRPLGTVRKIGYHDPPEGDEDT